jgi:hypothetical protein
MYIYSGAFSAIRKNEIMLFVGKWIELEIIISEINQIEKDKSKQVNKLSTLCAF